MSLNIFTVLLAVIALVSPLLTFTYVWQLKEWRYDRMRVYTQEEGCRNVIIGTMRGYILLLYIGAFITPWISERTSAICTLLALAILSGVQLALARQPLPTWTQKAKIVLMLSSGINVVLLAVLQYTYLLFSPISIVLIVGQVAIVGCAIALLKPLDTYLKRKIITQATALRASLTTTPVIGITGSVGKTTTKEILKHILAHKDALVTPAHVNTEMGVATWFIAEMQHRSAPPAVIIVEMGAYRIGEIATLCTMMQPTIGIITAISSQHIGLFGSQENIFIGKSELFNCLPTTGTALCTMDYPLTKTLPAQTSATMQTFGTDASNMHILTNVCTTNSAVSFTLQDITFTIPMTGSHTATNCALAIGAVQALGIAMPLQEIKEQIATFGGIEHTCNVQTKNTVTIVDDTHNASEASMLAAIEWAKQQEHQSKILCTSGLIELGGEFDTIHQKIGLEARRVFDRIICTNQRSAAAIAKGFGAPVELFNNNTKPVPKQALLFCEGRISTKVRHALLPE